MFLRNSTNPTFSGFESQLPCHALSTYHGRGEMFIKSPVIGRDKAGVFKQGMLMTVATRLLSMTGKLQHGYFLVATLPMVGKVMSLVARQPSWRLEDLFKNSEKSKLHLTGDVGPSLHTESLLFAGHNYHFPWLGLTIESPS
jgi:hypothetical protein